MPVSEQNFQSEHFECATKFSFRKSGVIAAQEYLNVSSVINYLIKFKIFNIVQNGTEQNGAVQYSTVQYCTPQYITVQYCISTVH